MNKVVIISPSKYSLYAICAAELLRRENIEIQAIFVKELFSLRRFTSEFSRDGTRLLKKIWRKLILRKMAYKPKPYQTILNLMKEKGITDSSLDYLGKRTGIPIIYCKDLNHEAAVNRLKKISPDIVVFTGGGLIREPLLAQAGHGILNCHMGVLPKYRGMDVVEWPMIEGNFETIGTTVHFMDTGVDTGDILAIKKIAANANETTQELRERFEPIMCLEMVNTCVRFLRGEIKRKPQASKEGKQYFILHDRLMEIARSRLARRS